VQKYGRTFVYYNKNIFLKTLSTNNTRWGKFTSWNQLQHIQTINATVIRDTISLHTISWPHILDPQTDPIPISLHYHTFNSLSLSLSAYPRNPSYNGHGSHLWLHLQPSSYTQTSSKLSQISYIFVLYS
jgi:hypothetical protein